VKNACARLLPLSLAAVASAAALLVLFWFAPENYAFYPRCLFHTLTGLQCPGCGGLRAAHRLLHGDLAGAFRLNPFLVGLTPLFAIWAVTYGVYEMSGKRSWYPFTRPAWVWTLLGAGLIFGVARNIVH